MKLHEPSGIPKTTYIGPKTPSDRFFAAAATGSTQWWRWVLGTIAVIGMFLGIVLVVTQACTSSALAFICHNEIHGVSVLLEYGLRYLHHAAALVGVWLVARLLHKKTLTQVTTGRTSFDYGRALLAALALLCVASVVLLLYRLIPGVEVTFQARSLREFLPLVLAVLIFVSIQSGAEEVFFRGYILQGLSLLTRNKLVLAIGTAFLFTVPHLVTSSDLNVIEIVILSLVLMPPGILLAVMTLLDGGIELAVGYHAMQNIFNKLVLNLEVGRASSSSLFAADADQAAVLTIYFVHICGLALALLILNLRYKWFAYPWSKSTQRS